MGVDKPVLVAATGGTGRHSLVLEHALRPMFAYLSAVVMPTAVFAATEEWGGEDGAQGPLHGRVERAARELAAEVERRDTPAIGEARASCNTCPSSFATRICAPCPSSWGTG